MKRLLKYSRVKIRASRSNFNGNSGAERYINFETKVLNQGWSEYREKHFTVLLLMRSLVDLYREVQ